MEKVSHCVYCVNLVKQNFHERGTWHKTSKIQVIFITLLHFPKYNHLPSYLFCNHQDTNGFNKPFKLSSEFICNHQNQASPIKRTCVYYYNISFMTSQQPHQVNNKWGAKETQIHDNSNFKCYTLLIKIIKKMYQWRAERHGELETKAPQTFLFSIKHWSSWNCR